MNRTDEKKIIRLSVMLVVFALALAACSPATPATSTGAAGPGAARSRSGTPAARNPIPNTGSTATLLPPPGVATAASSPTSSPSPSPTATMMPTQPPVSRGPAVMLGSKSGLGSFLVDARGMTLYIFKSDTTGVSNCGAGCASAWPPLDIKAGLTPAGGSGVTGKLDVFKRSDGSLQVTYNGWPLYYFSGDTNPGDTNGQGIGGLWFAAPLAGSQPPRPTFAPANPSMQSGGGGY
jgi:predicted lipoprotein with Yx(FWY)xxD motif